ncbi:UDP-glucose 4-epimerase GalE [Ornithinibacillus californiensis]|uniref:UDP-glucose 4-epimerase GalE n=1 Tax=Ornithinibacillus californiensis TaxID=161536 RepID=UPI0009FBB4DA|nr:UDP-glucose 4-epimerase GalE [Ornithinibacillus californiensis]
MAILVTGGAGYIGSHTCVELLQAGYEIVVIDNYSNSSPVSLNRVEAITGRQFVSYDVDLLDRHSLRKVFQENDIEAVIHFAGLKAVGESVSVPLKYYQNNIAGTLALCEVMQEFGVKKLVFSSSATVYGQTERIPITEGESLGAINPYGRTKQMIEEILRDIAFSDPEWSVAILRYFNPIGAHDSGLIGEDPNGVPNNLMPYIAQVAVGKRKQLQIFGKDYPTKDGTGIRDYIHVVDLAIGHIRALERINQSKGIEAYNLGTGRGYSVLEVVEAFEKATGKKIPYKFVDRRSGDASICYADPTKARVLLKWEALRDLERMCVDTWNWQRNNPYGYRDTNENMESTDPVHSVADFYYAIEKEV